ncbi:MAG: hypothetical protein GY757_58850, partial [bacterium]|nr:hypothetical protein [bacterium]
MNRHLHPHGYWLVTLSARDKPVPRETLEEIIQVARYAPSGHNNQWANWLIISDKNEI